MNSEDNNDGTKLEGNECLQEGSTLTKTKTRSRGRKRKRQDSESSTDVEDILPENMLEVEKNLHVSAIKNNLDDVSVRKILKKVVTNDHVLALVKLREEEEEADSGTEEKNLRPKLTRSKIKELMKISPKAVPWNAVALSPIKHIPVKTRPEVKALIAQELPEDEDDEEYEPTHEDVQSDDDHTIESCSDLDSQPRTPATPRSQSSESPLVVKDGPFKVPQDIKTPVRRKLIVEEEEATIALRTRSKLSLSATPIEHIESSFIPPDDIPTPDVDDPVWNEFLNDCLDPTCVSRTEEDDEADPEYNVAADPDAHDEDDAVENNMFRISKKELNDLVTELFSIMPEAAADDVLAQGMVENVLTENGQTKAQTHWDGKVEPPSDEDIPTRANRTSIDKGDVTTRFSIGKTEPQDIEDEDTTIFQKDIDGASSIVKKSYKERVNSSRRSSSATVQVSVREETHSLHLAPERIASPPPPLRDMQKDKIECVNIQIGHTPCILPEQILILQQQLRQHIQLAASNYLQLYVNPVHWSLAPTYKEYLEQFNQITESNAESVVNVCNLRPALDLVQSWVKSVSEDTPENKKLVEFLQSEAERSRRRYQHNNLYVGDFPLMLQEVVANSTVFLYPYLLPAMPYRADTKRKFSYRRSEDELIALALDQFWEYVEANPQIFKPPAKNHPRQRWGLSNTAQLVCKHLFPWISPRLLLARIAKARKDNENPIYKFFEHREVTPVNHKLLPFNPKLTLYEHPEHEMPRIWVRFLAKSSKRFRNYLYARKQSGLPPANGVSVNIGSALETPEKQPLPIDFTKVIVSNRANVLPKIAPETIFDKFDVNIQKELPHTQYLVLNTPTTGGEAQVIGRMLPVNIIPTADVTIKTLTSHVTGETAFEKNNMPKANEDNCTEIINSESPLAETIKSRGQNKDISNSDVPKDSNDNVLQTENVPTDNTQNVKRKPMYRLVETSTGSFLVPLQPNVKTATVNSITTPISSIKENNTKEIQNNTSQTVTTTTARDENNDHCQCCVLLKKIYKRKQRFITEFFQPKNTVISKCECTDKEYPKISKRLKMLVYNYKRKSECVYRDIQSRLREVENKTNCGTRDEKNIHCDDFDINEFASVVSYQLKLTARSGIVRNTHMKKQINNIFSKFDVDNGDPISLAEELYKTFGVDLADLYKEFLGFLTPVQADRIKKYKDYFTYACIDDVLKKVDVEIKDKCTKGKILAQLNSILTDNQSAACEMCFNLLNSLKEHPVLAKYIFSLFPHRASRRKETIFNTDRSKKVRIKPFQTKENQAVEPTLVNNTTNLIPDNITIVQPQDNIDKQVLLPVHNNATEHMQEAGNNIPEQREERNVVSEETEVEHDDNNLTICDDETYCNMDYEADHSSSDDEDYIIEITHAGSSDHAVADIKTESTQNPSEQEEQELMISKTEVQEYSEPTCMTMVIMSDDELIKSEAPDWKREDDKLVLEKLMKYVTSKEKCDKTILEVIEENNVCQTIAETLTDKTLEVIRERVMYLLEILVLSDY